jgi:hypothetical protein
LEAANSLLRHIRRNAREALIDGTPWMQFWGETVPTPAPEKKAVAASPKYRLLREEDEAEVERLLQVLKTVGHLDSRNGPEEK